MHQECGQSIVGAELAAFRETPVRLCLVNVSGDVPADCPQQVVILEIQRRNDAGLIEDDEAEQAVTKIQWNDEPPIFMTPDPVVQHQPIVLGWTLSELVQIDYPLSLPKELGKRGSIGDR